MPEPAKVFVSYAREDRETARRLWLDLKAAGFAPWLDSENLLGGQNWKLAITEAIKSSAFFVALISNFSIQKRGYVQKELKQALEIPG